MNATRERLQADAASLEAFAALNPRHIAVTHRTPDLRRFTVAAHVDAPVAVGDGFRITHDHVLLIEIPDNYLARDANGLFVKSRIRRDGERVFHPNVWATDGFFCYDSQFHPAKSLATQLYSALNLMQCREINHDSPANWDADYFFLQNSGQVVGAIRPALFRIPVGGIRVHCRSVPRLR